MASPEEIDLSRPDNWTHAQTFSSAFGAIPSSFTTTIRALMADGIANPNTLSPSSLYLMTRFAKIPGMKAPIYFAARTFHKSQLSADYLPVKDLVKLFKAHEMAAIIGLLYLYRRARKLCNAEEWPALSKNILDTVDIGGHLGMAIPTIGPNIGMLVAGTPILAQVAFSIKDLKGFKEYRRGLKSSGQYYSPQDELKRWDTTAVHVAAVFLQILGIGIPVANAFIQSFTSQNISSTSDPEAYRLYITNRWIQELRKTGKIPEMTHDGRYYPLKDDLSRLMDAVKLTVTNGSEFSWLEKNKESISPELTPQLYKPGETVPAAAAGEQKEKISYEQLPAEVKELFSKEEFDAMTAEELDELLKQVEEGDE